MQSQFSTPAQRVKINSRCASSLVSELLMPSERIAKICDEIGYQFRARTYTPMVTAWMFILQVLSADHSCQQAVARFNTWRVARGLPRVSSETTSYCKARCRLPETLFERLLAWTAQQCQAASPATWLFRGRIVEMVDGWIVTMADSKENQEAYPQQRGQKAGCGFPLARMIGVFSLATGAINLTALGPYKGKETGETSLLRSILDRISPGRILLADRYYATFWLLAQSEMKGIDLVARAHHLRKIDFRKGLKQGYLDQLVSYQKPKRPKWLTPAEYATYPDSILVRHIKYQVQQKGFRTRTITLATTLLDAEVYPAHDLSLLYRRRWLVELHIRSLKTRSKR